MSSLSHHLKKPFFFCANALFPKFLFSFFLGHDQIFEKYLDTPDQRSKLLQSDESKVFFLRTIINQTDPSESNLRRVLFEYISQVDSDPSDYKDSVVKSYRKLIAESYNRRDLHEFEYFLQKIKPFDPVFEHYYRLFARQFLKSDVEIHEWEKLLEEARVAKSDIYEKVSSQLLVKYIHAQDLDKSIRTFEKTVRASDLLDNMHIAIGILKLCAKLNRLDDASRFKKFLVRKAWGRANKNLMELKLLEISSKHQGSTWQSAFDLVLSMKMPPENKAYFQELQTIYQSLEKKNKLLLDIRTDISQQEKVLSLIQSKLVNLEPFLLIRLGDGESYGFPAGKMDPAMYEKDIRIREMKWWGELLPVSIRKKLTQQFQETIHASDVIGIPSIYRFFRAMKGLDISLLVNSDLRGSLIVMEQMLADQHKGYFKESIFIEHRSHQNLFTTQKIKDLAKFAKKTIVISHYEDDVINKAFDFPIETIKIPAERTKHESLPYKMDAFVEMLKAKVEPGVLVLVASGFAGKYFLKVAKDAGAVGLDVGSMADYWVGRKTRQVADIV